MVTSSPKTHHPERRWPRSEDSLRRNYADAATVVDCSGVAEEIEERIITRHPDSGKIMGRPRELKARAWLVAGIMLALDDRDLTIANVSELLNRLPDDLLDDLGLRRRHGHDDVTNPDAVGHLWLRMTELTNDSATIDGKRLRLVDDLPVVEYHAKALDWKAREASIEVGAMSAPLSSRKVSTRGTPREISDQEAEERRRLRAWMADTLLAATWPSGARLGAIAVDWTDHETMAKNTTSKKTSADPDARHGRRRPKNGLSFKKKGTSKSRSGPNTGAPQESQRDSAFETDKSAPFFGYNIHFAVATAEIDGAPVPEVALSMRVTPANDMDVGPILVEVVDTVLAGEFWDADQEPEVAADRGYSMRSPEKVHLPLARRGVHFTFDFTSSQYGRRGTHKGAPLIGGIPHCPGTPVDVTNEPPPPPSASPDDWAAYWKRRKTLDAYAFRRLGAASADLKNRFECPAKSKNPKVRCPLVPKSQSVPAEKDIPEVYDPPDAPLPCCNTSFSAGPDVGLGERQRHPHGSDGWTRSYDRRSGVERFNSAIKMHTNIDADDIHVLGLAKRTMVILLSTVATNVRLVRRWAEETGQEASRLADPECWDPRALNAVPDRAA